MMASSSTAGCDATEVDLVCPVCMDIFNFPSSANCGHIFCSPCLVSWSASKRNTGLRPNCPLCRADFQTPPLPDLQLMVKANRARRMAHNPLVFLCELAHLPSVRSLLQVRPERMNTIKKRISESSPRGISSLSQNQDAFVQLISQFNSNGTEERIKGVFMATKQDKEIIDRLKRRLRLPEYLVVQAYYNFNKNEYQASQFLTSPLFSDFVDY